MISEEVQISRWIFLNDEEDLTNGKEGIYLTYE